MHPMNPAAYAVIGHRLSMQLLSPSGYGQPSGKAEIERASLDFYDISHTVPYGFEFEVTPTESVDFLNGPDIVVGYLDEPTGYFNNPLFAFIYDELNSENRSNNFYNAYQARVIFETSIQSHSNDITCKTLNHALRLISLKANLHTHLIQESMSITLGIHEDIPKQIPNLVKTMQEAGFSRDDGYSEGNQLQVFKMKTSLNP